MKKIILIAAMLLAAFSSISFASSIVDRSDVSRIISEYYPGLKDYYEAGVIDIESLTEETLFDGSTEYNIKYRFVKSCMEKDEAEKTMKASFPRTYFMEKAGLIKGVAVYRFVDRKSGKIVTGISYSRM